MQLLACVAVCVAALSVTAAGLVAQRPLFPLPSPTTRSRSDVPQVARRSSGTARTSDGVSSADPLHSSTTQQQGHPTAATPSSRESDLRQDAIVLQGIQTNDDSIYSVNGADQALRDQALLFNLPPQLLWQLQQQGFSVQQSPTTLFAQNSNQPSTQVVSTNSENNNFQNSFQHQFPSQFSNNAQISQQQVAQQSSPTFLSLTSPLQTQFDSQLRSRNPFIQANQRPANSNLFIQANQHPQNFQNIPIFQHRSNNIQSLHPIFLQNGQQNSQFQHQPQQQLFHQQNVQQGSATSDPRYLTTSNTHLLNGQFFQQVSPQLQTNTQQIRANPFQFQLNEIGQSFTPVSPVQQTVTQTVFVPVLATDLLHRKPISSETQRSLHQENNSFSLFQEVSTQTPQIKTDDLPQPATNQEMIFEHEETQNVASTEQNIPRENKLQTNIKPAVFDVGVASIADTPSGETFTEGPFEPVRAKEANPIDILEIDSTNKVIVSPEQIKVNVETDNDFVNETEQLQNEFQTVILALPTDVTETEDLSKEIIKGPLEQNIFNNLSGVDNSIPLIRKTLDTEFMNTSTNETAEIQEEITIVNNFTAVQEIQEIALDDKVVAGSNLALGAEKQHYEHIHSIDDDESLSSNINQKSVNNEKIGINIVDSITEPSTTEVTPEDFSTTVDSDFDLVSVVSDTPFSYEDISIPDEVATTESQILQTEAPIVTSVTSTNPKPIITESTVAQRIHHNNVDIIKEHFEPDSITAFQTSDEILLANDSHIFSISSDLEEVTEINDDVVPTERNGSNNFDDLVQDEIMPNSFEGSWSHDEASNYTENIIYDELLAEADTATIGFSEFDYNFDSNDGTTADSGTILLNNTNASTESTTENITETDYPVDYDANLQFITERTSTGVVETKSSDEAVVTSALTKKSETNHIQLERPRIVERTVISISTTTNPKPTKRNASSAVQSDDIIVSDVEIMNNTQFASSEHIPTFTIFINPKTGRIFKRSTTAVPPAEIDSLMSSIFEKRERDLGTANPRFPRRQGLFTLFNEKQNSNRNVNKQGKSEKITQSTVTDVDEEKESTNESEGRLPARNRSRLLALRKTEPRTLPPSKSRSLSSRFTKQDEVTEIPAVTQAPVEITTRTSDGGVDTVMTVTESALASGEDDKIDININNTSVKKQSLEEQLKVLLRNKSTQDQVRRRLLTTRTPNARLLGRKAGNQDAQSSIAVETKTLPDKPGTSVQENTESGPRTLRFNRFRNQNNNQQEQRSDRARVLASRFRNRNPATDSAVASTATTTTSPIHKNTKPKQNEAVQSRVLDSLRPKFKATRFEGFRKNATSQRRPFIFTPTFSTTTPIPFVLSAFISDFEDNTEKISVSTTENDLTAISESTMLPESPGIGSVFQDDNDIKTLNPPVSIETEIETSTSSSFVEKFTEFSHNPTEEVLTSSKMPPISRKNETESDEILINIDLTTAMGDQENSSFITTDLPLEQSEFENIPTSIIDETVVDIPLEDTTEQFKNVFNELFTESFLGNQSNFRNDSNTESMIPTSTFFPFTTISDNTEATHDDNQQVSGLQNSDSNEITGKKSVNPILNPNEITNETVADIFSKMLMSISKPQAILESMNAHVPTDIVNIRNGHRSAEGLLRRNIVGSSHTSSAEDAREPAQFLTTPDAKKSRAKNLNLTNGISVSSLTEEISKRMNRFRPSVHNIGNNQERTMEDATVKTLKSSLVHSLQPVLVETFNSDQNDIIPDSLNEEIQITEPPFALIDSIHDENQLLRPNPLVTSKPDQIVPEVEELKHVLMKGDFSLLIDGTLLEEVTANQKSTIEKANRTRGIRVFDIPVMMNIPKLTPNSEQEVSLLGTDNFSTSDEKSPGQVIDALSGSTNNRVSSVLDKFVTIADGDASGTERSPFRQISAESLDLKHPPIDQFMAGDSIGPHSFEIHESLLTESLPFEHTAQKGIDFSSFDDEILNNETSFPQIHVFDAHQSRQENSIVTEFPITNQQSEFDYDSIFEPSQLEIVEDPSTLNETDQFVQFDNIVSSPEFFSSDLSSRRDRQFEQENFDILASVENTTPDNLVDIAELEPRNVIQKSVKAPLFHELFPLFPKEKLSQPSIEQIGTTTTPDTNAEPPTTQFAFLPQKTESQPSIVQIGTTATPDTNAEPPTTQFSFLPQKTTESIEKIETISHQQPSFLQNMEKVLHISRNKNKIFQRGENVLRPVKVDQLFFEQPIPTTTEITTQESEGNDKLLFAHDNVLLSTPETVTDLLEFEQFITTNEAESTTHVKQLTTTERVESFTDDFEPFDFLHSQNVHETLADISSESSTFGSDVIVEVNTLSSPLDGVLENVSTHEESIVPKFESTTERFSELFAFISTEEQESVTEINLSVPAISITNKIILNTKFSDEVGSTINDEIGTKDNLFVHSTLDKIDQVIEKQDIKHFGPNISAHEETTIPKFESATESFSDLFGVLFTEKQEPVTEINLSESAISVPNKMLSNTEFPNEVASTINDRIEVTNDHLFDTSTKLDEVDHLIKSHDIGNFEQEPLILETPRSSETEQEILSNDPVLSTVQKTEQRDDEVNFERASPSSVQTIIPRVVVLNHVEQSPTRDTERQLSTAQNELNGFNRIVHHDIVELSFTSEKSSTPTVSLTNQRLIPQDVSSNERKGVANDEDNIPKSVPKIEQLKGTIGDTTPLVSTKLDSDVGFNAHSDETNTNNRARPITISKIAADRILNDNKEVFQTFTVSEFPNEAIPNPEQRNQDAHRVAEDHSHFLRRKNSFERETVIERHASKNNVSENIVAPMVDEDTEHLIAQKKIIRITSLTLLTPSPPLQPRATPFPRRLIPRPLESNFLVKPAKQRFDSKQIQNVGTLQEHHAAGTHDLSKDGDVGRITLNPAHDEVVSEIVSSRDTIVIDVNKPAHPLPTTLRDQPDSFLTIDQNGDNFENHRSSNEEVPTTFVSFSSEDINHVPVETTTEEITASSTESGVDPVIISTTESIVPSTTDTLHNFTNDELLILDLLADIVESAPTSTTETPPVRGRGSAGFRTTGREQLTPISPIQDPPRDSKSIETSKRVFSTQHLQFISKEANLGIQQPRVHFESNDQGSNRADRVVVRKTIFPPPLPQFPIMPSITTPQPVFKSIPRRTNNRSPRLNQQTTSTPSPFGFGENFPFHVFDSFTAHNPVRQRSVSSPRGNTNTVSPNFSFFQIFNPPQSARLESKTSLPDTTQFPFLGRSAATQSNDDILPQPRRNINERSITSGPSRTQALLRPQSKEQQTIPRQELSSTRRPKIVSMRTKSGSLFFIPEDRVAQTMKMGMGTPLDFTNSPSGH